MLPAALRPALEARGRPPAASSALTGLTHRPLPPHPPVTYRPLTGSTERGCPASQTRSLVPRGSSKFSSHKQHLLAGGLGVLSLPVPALCLSHRASAQCGRIPAFSPRCGTVGFSPEWPGSSQGHHRWVYLSPSSRFPFLADWDCLPLC